jgi:TctA family transporter
MFLEMQANPAKWQDEPIIKIGNNDIRRILNASDNFVSFNAMFDAQTGIYKLQNQVTTSYEKKANERNKFDKEIINIDERVNVLMQVFTGKFLAVFPVPGDANHKWVSLDDAGLLGTEGETFAKNSLTGFLAAAQKNDAATATALLNKLKQYQETEGAKIIPPKYTPRFYITT